MIFHGFVSGWTLMMKMERDQANFQGKIITDGARPYQNIFFLCSKSVEKAEVHKSLPKTKNHFLLT